MDLTPQAIASNPFRVVKKGYDPDEVRAFLAEVSREVETTQNHAQAMEARARQALARVQELTSAPTPVPPAPAPVATPAAVPVAAPSPDADAISRALVTAQRVADQTVAEAKAEADKISAKARSEHDRLLGEASATAARTINEARTAARSEGEAEKVRVGEEVDSLLDRLDYLKHDVAAMERHASFHRNRLRELAEELAAAADSPLDGLGVVERPGLSAAGDGPRTGSRAAANAAASAASAAEPWTPDAPTLAIPVTPSADESVSTRADASGGAAGSDAESGSASLASLFEPPVTQEVPVVLADEAVNSAAANAAAGMRILGDDAL